MSILAIFFSFSNVARRQQGLAAASFTLRTSPDVVGALVPAVRAALVNAVFAFGSVEKAALAQKRFTDAIKLYSTVLGLRLAIRTCTKYASLHA